MEAVCEVCEEALVKSEEVTVTGLKSCGHVFHEECTQKLTSESGKVLPHGDPSCSGKIDKSNKLRLFISYEDSLKKPKNDNDETTDDMLKDEIQKNSDHFQALQNELGDVTKDLIMLNEDEKNKKANLVNLEGTLESKKKLLNRSKENLKRAQRTRNDKKEVLHSAVKKLKLARKKNEKLKGVKNVLRNIPVDWQFQHAKIDELLTLVTTYQRENNNIRRSQNNLKKIIEAEKQRQDELHRELDLLKEQIEARKLEENSANTKDILNIGGEMEISEEKAKVKENSIAGTSDTAVMTTPSIPLPQPKRATFPPLKRGASVNDDNGPSSSSNKKPSLKPFNIVVQNKRKRF